MKSIFTRIVLWRLLVFLFLLLYSLIVFPQPDYRFQSGTVFSGTDLQKGCVYRYLNVRMGVDARVRIDTMTGGLTLSSADGAGGFNEALQPSINVPAWSSGYVQFTVTFYTAGTSNPMVQTMIPITPIDVDGQTFGGGQEINEYDMIQWGASSYVDFDMTGGEMDIFFPTGWVEGINYAGIDYAGIDTMAKQVMFSVVRASTSTITFRVGANNQSSSLRNRLRSVYFKRFNYNNSYLSSSECLSFNGVSKERSIDLNWQLTEKSDASTIILEKSNDAINYSDVAQYWMDIETNSNRHFSFSDSRTNTGKPVYYRLKFLSAYGKIAFSNILVFNNETKKSDKLKVYPTLVQSSFTIVTNSDRAQKAVLEVTDLSGKTVHTQSLKLDKGENDILVNDVSRIPRGQYVVVVRKQSETSSAILIKQ